MNNIKSETKKTLNAALTLRWLEHAMIKSDECQPVDFYGKTYDAGPEYDSKILAGFDKMIKQDAPLLKDREVNAIISELAEVWLRYKGVFETLRLKRDMSNLGGNSSVKHWVMLYITYPAFREIAEFIGCSDREKCSVESVYRGIEHRFAPKEVRAVLETMVSLGGLTKVRNSYYRSAMRYGNFLNGMWDCNHYRVKNYLEVALTNIAKDSSLPIMCRGALYEEYAVTKDSKIAKAFWPFQELLEFDENGAIQFPGCYICENEEIKLYDFSR